jgi:poly-gamma-glutamate synthesis protein (capsule biosynthesis protein)
MKIILILLLSVFLLAGCAPAAEPAAAAPVRLLLGGDLQFDRYIRQQIVSRGPDFPLQPLHSRLLTYDAVIANLEGPITAFPSRSAGSAFGSRDNYIFTSPPETARLLRDENIRAVNLGNNHIGNFGEEGINQTRENLEKEGISYFGHTGKKSVHRFTIFTIRDLRIGLVNYNQFVAGGTQAALSDLAAARPLSDMVIVYTHWGAEYQPQAAPSVQALARQFIDLGADLVIGSHPHVIQPEETYQGKKIYYSLGNFVFDQYFRPETQRGLLVEAEIDPQTKTIVTKTIPIKLLPTGQTTDQL